jgi:hypothetical protein
VLFRDLSMGDGDLLKVLGEMPYWFMVVFFIMTRLIS